MAFYRGPGIVKGNLTMCFDAANPISYISGSTTYTNLSRGNIVTTATLTNQNSTVTVPQYSSENLGVLTFNGTGSVVSILTNPSTSGFWPIPQFTLETWFKSPSLGSGQALGGIFGFTYGVGGYLLNTGNIRFIVYSTTSSGVSITDTSKNYFDNQWHYVAFINNGISSSLYVDGTLKTSGAAPWNGTSPWPTNQLAVGRDNNSSNYYFSGSIGPIKIYNKALTATEITQNYNAVKTRFGL
jgi:hypothetical protein